eukprot:jgi/Galph1/3636/GphlegSOOS_G2255.1
MGSVLSRVGCTMMGLVYPAYCTFKTLKTQDFGDQTQWLTFWLVISCFFAIERLLDILFGWLPLYYEAKLLLVGWLALPPFRGASFLYRHYLGPYLLKREGQIDAIIENFKNNSVNSINDWAIQGIEYVKKKGLESVAQDGNDENRDPNVVSSQKTIPKVTVRRKKMFTRHKKYL